MKKGGKKMADKLRTAMVVFFEAMLVFVEAVFLTAVIVLLGMAVTGTGMAELWEQLLKSGGPVILAAKIGCLVFLSITGAISILVPEMRTKMAGLMAYVIVVIILLMLIGERVLP
jgi:hypothetical protein